MKLLGILGMLCLVALTAGCATNGSSSGANSLPVLSTGDALGAMYQGNGRQELYAIGKTYSDSIFPLSGEEYEVDPLGVTLNRVELVDALLSRAKENATPSPIGKRFRIPLSYSTLHKPKKSTYHPENTKLPEWADFWMILPMEGLVRIPKASGDLPLEFYVQLKLYENNSRGYYGPKKLVYPVRQSDFDRVLSLYQAGNDEALRKLYHKDRQPMLSFTLGQCSGNHRKVVCTHVPSDDRKRRRRPKVTLEKM